MSKKRPPAVPRVHHTPPAVEQSASVKEVPLHRRCPLCWEGHGGYGHCYSSDGAKLKSYYKCQFTTSPLHPPCGHTWTVTVTHHQTVIEHRTVHLSSR